MIRSNITSVYPAHMANYCNTDKSIYIADYTQQTKAQPVRKGVEVFAANPPADICYFSLVNNHRLDTGYTIFDNSSFTYPNGTPRSQCECVVFPHTAVADSWILFAELKYSQYPLRNEANLRKAIGQLYKTRTYYFRQGIFNLTNTCYLVASLPMQPEPFANFSLPPARLQQLKQKHNVVVRLRNTVEIIDDKSMRV